MGFLSVNAGPLKNARYLEPVGGLNIYFGYGAGLGTTVAPSWIGIE
jgi:8-hydroxy-5-deazaflavin:NADPH oxidoreductase